MTKFFATITIPSSNKEKKITVEANNIKDAESTLVTEHMSKLENGSVGIIKRGDDFCRITKDETNQSHWNHKGYVFSG